MGAFDQARDDGGGAEGAFHDGIAREPSVEAVAQGARVEERGWVGYGVEAPDQGGVVGRDEAERGEALGFHLFCQEKAEGLLGVSSREAVDAEVFAAVVGEAFGEGGKRGRGGVGDLALFGEPPGGVGGKVGPGFLLEDFEDAVGEEG